MTVTDSESEDVSMCAYITFPVGLFHRTRGAELSRMGGMFHVHEHRHDLECDCDRGGSILHVRVRRVLLTRA